MTPASPAVHGPPNAGTDVLVIGAGAVGAAAARGFAVAGATVTVVDRAPGIGGGCSYANAGILAPDHVTPLATPALLLEAPVQMLRRPPAVRVRPARGLGTWLARLTASSTPARARSLTARLQDLARASTRLHVELAERGLNPTLRKSGAIDVHLRATTASRATGALSPDRLRDLEPGLADVAAGFHRTEEWTVESRSFVRSMLHDAGRHGADVRYSTTVEGFDRYADGRITSVRTDRGRIRADHVVLAGGLDAAGLARQVGLTLPLRGGRGYVIDLAGGADVLRTPVRLKEHRVVVTPLPDRIRVCGSIEFGRETRRPDLDRADALLRVATRAVPGLGSLPVVDRWSGERPCTRDGVPAIGTTAAAPNLSIAAGHGMWGLVLAPVTAELLTRRAPTGSADPALDWLDPDRFTARTWSPPPGTATAGTGAPPPRSGPLGGRA